MQEIKLKVEETGRIFIGDIWVKVDIQFKPQIKTDDMREELVIDAFNNRLDLLAGELEIKVRKIVEEKLSNPHSQGG